jgi:CheY-like chemotaxis protein
MSPRRVLIADDHQLDRALPVLDGVHTTRLLRRLFPACPVVVLAASLSPEDAHRARSAGAAAACVYATAAETESEAEGQHQVAQP